MCIIPGPGHGARGMPEVKGRMKLKAASGMGTATWATVAGLLLFVAACSSSGSNGPADPDPMQDVVPPQDVLGETGPLDIPDNATTPELTDPGTSETMFEDTIPETTVETVALEVLVPESPCDQPELADCPSTTPPPEGQQAIKKFVADNAIPLTCDASGGQWDYTVFMREFQGRQVLVLGEIHGSNEIGPDSVDLAEHLVRHAGVDTWVLEIGMDTTEALNAYAQTGDAAAAQAIGFQMYGDNMFRRVFPERALALQQEGLDVYLAGIDVPQRLAWVNEQIEALVEGLTDPARALVLDTIPPPREVESYGMFGLETAYVNLTKAYHEHILDSLDTVCQALTADECEWLEKLSLALWTGAIMASQDFMMAAMTGQDMSAMIEMLKAREELVKYLFERAIEARPGRVYAHMGAAHAGKGTWTVSSYLDEEVFTDQDAVYTVTPAIGNGSQVFYGIMSQPVPAEPPVISSALDPQAGDRYFLAADEPGQDCSESPFMDHPIPDLDGSFYGVAYDAFVWYRKLTADTPGGMFYSAPPWKQQFFRDQVRRLQYGNRLMTGRRAW